MEKWVVASMRPSAGKTSAIVGLAGMRGKKIGYMKPFGERLLYRKKRLWDYDSSVVTSTFGLPDDPVDLSIGFDHSKLRYLYDEERTREKLLEMMARVEKDREVIFIEGGRDLASGISVHLDALSVARFTGARLLLIVSGDEDTILDDLVFFQRHVHLADIRLAGVILNKLSNLKDFQNCHLPVIARLGIPVLGMIPYESRLTYYSMAYLAERLFAKVITGEEGLKRKVKNVIIGAWSASVAQRDPVFHKESKLVITGGDRTDMILAALESDTSGIVLTNNILPPPRLISKAAELKIPLLLVSSDTFQTAQQIDRLEPLLAQEDAEKIELLIQMCKDHIHLGETAKGVSSPESEIH
ncbi:MAG: AAA family ATPase [Deltaproteobacteria bacterium]|nr:AAA family ATPase [Deltaproteobacteria bacterium]